MTVADRILETLSHHPAGLSDAQLAKQLGLVHQHVNTTCRQLARKQLLIRQPGSPIINIIVKDAAIRTATDFQQSGRPRPAPPEVSVEPIPASSLVFPACFSRVTDIDCTRDRQGHPAAYTAHERFSNPDRLRLNKYGAGPFVTLRLDPLPSDAGVYAVTVNGHLMYLGLTSNLAQRWGRQGYSVIDPRNCFVGGQSTNCHVNHLVGEALAAGKTLELWFRPTPSPAAVEAALIRVHRPAWNTQQPSG